MVDDADSAQSAVSGAAAGAGEGAGDYHLSSDPSWQPYRDPATGEVVKLTALQCAAVRHAFSVYRQVVEAEKAKGSDPNPAFDVKAAAQLSTVSKSCLMGRLLYDGKAPLVDAPPVVHGAPDYSLEVVDPARELCEEAHADTFFSTREACAYHQAEAQLKVYGVVSLDGAALLLGIDPSEIVPVESLRDFQD